MQYAGAKSFSGAGETSSWCSADARSSKEDPALTFFTSSLFWASSLWCASRSFANASPEASRVSPAHRHTSHTGIANAWPQASCMRQAHVSAADRRTSYTSAQQFANASPEASRLSAHGCYT
eukprot:1696932-Rhodomonas_salina.1